MDTPTDGLTDAIASSRTLYDIATELRAEARRWAHPSCRISLLRDAAQCETAARDVLTNRDTLTAESIAIAADHQLAKVRAVRHFLVKTYR